MTKLDPDRPFTAATLDMVYASGTDAILVGGSTGMTGEAVSTLLDALRDGPLPVALEVSSLEAAMPGPALFLIPLVLNTPHGEWIGGAQTRALTTILPRYGPLIPWDLIVPEGYIVLNPDSTVARVTGAATGLDSEAAAAYAAFAGKVLRLPLLYVEYSGAFGNMETLRAVKDHCGDARVFYGGGVTTGELAAHAGAIADTVVVGNLVYNDPERLRETVSGVRAVTPSRSIV